MEEIMIAISLLKQNYACNDRIVIVLTRDTIRKLVKRQVGLGITEEDVKKIDFNKTPVGYFADYRVELDIRNSVIVENGNRIINEIRLPYNLIIEE